MVINVSLCNIINVLNIKKFKYEIIVIKMLKNKAELYESVHITRLKNIKKKL